MLKKRCNKKIIITSVILLVILIILMCFLYYRHSKEQNEIPEKDNQEQVDDTAKIDIYCKNFYEKCWLTTINNKDTRFFYQIKTQSSTPKVLYETPNAILYDDEGLKIFYGDTKAVEKIELSNTYDSYELVLRSEVLLGIIYKKDDFIGYYDYKLKRSLYQDNNGKILNNVRNDNYLIYSVDNKISIYDKNNNKVLKEDINLIDKDYNYMMLYNYETRELYGIYYYNDVNKNNGYYNFKINKCLYENQFFNISQNEEDYLIASRKTNSGELYDTNEYILNPYKESIIMSPMNLKKSAVFSVKKYNNKYYYIESTDLLEPHYYTKGYIYSNNKKLITIVEYYPGDYRGQNYIINENGILYVKENNFIKEFDIDGNLLSNKEYQNVINVTNNYLVIVENNILKIIDTITNEKHIVIEWKNNYKISKYVSNFLNIEKADEYFNPNGEHKNGIYMVLEDENNYTEYFYNPETKEITSRKIDDLDKYDLSINWSDLS